jgi:hypothetical protein
MNYTPTTADLIDDISLSTVIEHFDDDTSLMSDEEYDAYLSRLDDELNECYYSRGLTPPGMTPMPAHLADLTPPF